LCSYGQTVKVISRDAEKNNKKASGKMENEGIERAEGEKMKEREKERERGRERTRADFGTAVVVIFYKKTSLSANS